MPKSAAIWRITQSDANRSPVWNSLLNRENTGNFDDFSCRWTDLQPKIPWSFWVFARIPYSTEQGIISAEQGIFSAEQGFGLKSREVTPEPYEVSWNGGT
jgi:hypothetical protein